MNHRIYLPESHHKSIKLTHVSLCIMKLNATCYHDECFVRYCFLLFVRQTKDSLFSSTIEKMHCDKQEIRKGNPLFPRFKFSIIYV